MMILLVELLLLLYGPSVSALTLSPLQSLALGSRLEAIQQAIRKEIELDDDDDDDSTNSKMMNLPALIRNNKHPTIVFPGAGGPDVLTDELRASINGGNDNNAPSCIVWDWQQHRGSIATAAFDGEAVGEAVGKATIQYLQKEEEQLESMHIVGISVGAFCANAMASTLHDYCNSKNSGNATKRRIHIRITLLDPFCTRGLIGIGYGAKHFGVKADYAEHYVNTDDPVPSTNDPLPQCYCMDVTSASERKTFVLPEGESMHCWPLAYFARHVVDRDQPLPTHDEARPRGAVKVVL
jgi:hypothetical protein